MIADRVISQAVAGPETTVSGIPHARASSACAETMGVRVATPAEGSLVVSVTGDVDASTVDGLEEVLMARLTGAVRFLVVDLTGVDFLGVAGLQLLNRAHARARHYGIRLCLAACGNELVRGLQVCGLERLLERYSTLREALEAPH